MLSLVLVAVLTATAQALAVPPAERDTLPIYLASASDSTHMLGFIRADLSEGTFVTTPSLTGMMDGGLSCPGPKPFNVKNANPDTYQWLVGVTQLGVDMGPGNPNYALLTTGTGSGRTNAWTDATGTLPFVSQAIGLTTMGPRLGTDTGNVTLTWTNASGAYGGVVPLTAFITPGGSVGVTGDFLMFQIDSGLDIHPENCVEVIFQTIQERPVP
ncbi:hypothetical protein CALCODRAFT_516896 [Calocera cornea HHB12733]|uniref:Uncharacterized protein n=1 Tax=Calocera cornea HHB12733 TaxID=1353952 RepID=A0A165GRM9_9BASI|nr:hypothetical protein CALCODRAFT_516896 [Calocera cornea HHB12733]